MTMPWDPELSASLSTQWQDVDATSTLYDVALKLSVDTLQVQISATSSDVSSILSTYVFTQCGQVIGTVDIPKDFLVKRATLETVTEENVPYEGAKPGDKYIDFVINDQAGSAGESHVYVPVTDLVDIYSGGATDTISVAISSDNAVYAYVKQQSISSSFLADNAVTYSKIADGQVSMPKLSSDVIECISSISATAFDAINRKVFIDGISAQSLCAIHISQDDFYARVHLSSLLSNELYIVSSDYINAYNQQVKNVAEPVDSNDAVTKQYVDAFISAVPDLLSGLSVEVLSNDNFLSDQVSSLSDLVISNDNFLSDQISSLSDIVLSNDNFLSNQISSLSVLTLSNDVSLSTAIDSKIFIDGISTASLCAVHISQDDFYARIYLSSLLSNELYIVSSDYINAYGQQVKNVAEPVDLADAVTKQYVDSCMSSVPDLLSGLSVEMLSNNDFLSNQISSLSDLVISNDNFLSDQISSLSDIMLSNDNFLSNQLSLLSDLALSNDTMLSTTVDSKIFIDGISAQSLCAVYISQDDFYARVHLSSLLSNELYIVSSDYINAYNQQVKNVAEPIDQSDAATKQYADTHALCAVNAIAEISNFTGLSAASPVDVVMTSSMVSAQISALSSSLSSKQDALLDVQLQAISSVVDARATSMTFNDSTTSSFSFSGCIEQQDITDAGLDRDQMESRLMSLDIGTAVSAIGLSAFYGCALLSSLHIPFSVNTVSSYAFAGCRSLSTVYLPDSIQHVGDYAFKDCSSLYVVTVGTIDTASYDLHRNLA